MDGASAESEDRTEKVDEINNSSVDIGKETSKSDREDADLRSGVAENIPEATRDQIIATLYGQCMGDAIGLLSEFFDKEQAAQVCFPLHD